MSSWQVTTGRHMCRIGIRFSDDTCRLGIKRVHSLRFDPTEALKTSTLTITLPMQLKFIFGISEKTKTHSLVFQTRLNNHAAFLFLGS